MENFIHKASQKLNKLSPNEKLMVGAAAVTAALVGPPGIHQHHDQTNTNVPHYDQLPIEHSNPTVGKTSASAPERIAVRLPSMPVGQVVQGAEAQQLYAKALQGDIASSAGTYIRTNSNDLYLLWSDGPDGNKVHAIDAQNHTVEIAPSEIKELLTIPGVLESGEGFQAYMSADAQFRKTG